MAFLTPSPPLPCPPALVFSGVALAQEFFVQVWSFFWCIFIAITYVIISDSGDDDGDDDCVADDDYDDDGSGGCDKQRMAWCVVVLFGRA